MRCGQIWRRWSFGAKNRGRWRISDSFRVKIKLNKAHRNYSFTEQECLAVIGFIIRIRPYIEGHDFTVITDHASLKWLMSQTDLHRSGMLNVVPDALSGVNETEVAAMEARQGMLINVQSKQLKSETYPRLEKRVEANQDKT